MKGPPVMRGSQSQLHRGTASRKEVREKSHPSAWEQVLEYIPKALGGVVRSLTPQGPFCQRP